MPKPSDDLSDEQIHQGLTTGEYQGRDRAQSFSANSEIFRGKIKWLGDLDSNQDWRSQSPLSYR